MKKSVFVVGMAVMILTFGMVAIGCASNPSPSSSSVDSQQFVGVWLQDSQSRVNEITIRPDDTGTWTMYEGGKQGSFDLKLINGGKALTDGEDSFPISFNKGKMILAGKLTFSKAQPVEVSGSVWVQENNAFEITYTFAKDGTYKIEYGGIAKAVPGSQLNNCLDELSKAGIDGTGTYTVSDHYVFLKPKGKAYIVATPPGNFGIKEAETYTLVFINGNELFHGYYYKRK